MPQTRTFPVSAGGDDLAAVRAEHSAGHRDSPAGSEAPRAGGGRQQLQTCAIPPVPATASSRPFVAVRAVDDLVTRRERPDEPAAVAPDAYQPAHPGRRNLTSLRIERPPEERRVARTAEDRELFERNRLPDLCGPVRAGGDDGPSIRREGGRRDRGGMSGKRDRQSSGTHTPDPCGVVGGARSGSRGRRDSTAPSQRLHVRLVDDRQLSPTGCVPKTRGTVRASRNDLRPSAPNAALEKG